jgi:hypothetical protein
VVVDDGIIQDQNNFIDEGENENDFKLPEKMDRVPYKKEKFHYQKPRKFSPSL